MENYIVRIYRRDHNNPDQVTGILESVEEETQQTFHNLNALHSFLLRQPAESTPAETPSGKSTANPKAVGVSE